MTLLTGRYIFTARAQKWQLPKLLVTILYRHLFSDLDYL